MIDIKFSKEHHGMVVAYASKSFDARIAPRVHQFWQAQLSSSDYNDLHWMVIDLQEVLIMDASGLAVIVYHYQQLPAGSLLALVGCNLAVSQLLEDTYIAKVFPQYKKIHDIPEIGDIVKNTSTASYDNHRLHSPW